MAKAKKMAKRWTERQRLDLEGAISVVRHHVALADINVNGGDPDSAVAFLRLMAPWLSRSLASLPVGGAR
jgi:hypothetical protein